MKKTKILLTFVVSAFVALTMYILTYGQSVYPSYKSVNASVLLGGEHTPLIYSGTVYLPRASAAEQTTSWLQIGYSTDALKNTDALMKSSRQVFEVNPEKFTLSIRLASYPVHADHDSVSLMACRFELADSTSAVIPFWNGDSTNLFMANGNYNHSFYGYWMFEEPGLNSAAILGTREWIYPLRVLRGGYIRFVFTGSAGIDDSTAVSWTLWCEN